MTSTSTTPAPPKEFRTDAIRPAAIQTGTIGRRTHGAHASSNDNTGIDDAAEALEREYESWNTRIDTEMVSLSSGLRELLELANISPNPQPHIHQTTPLLLKVTTAQIIRSVQNIRDIAHDLKLALLLSNQVDTVDKRDREIGMVRDDVRARRREVGEGVVRLLSGERGDDVGEAERRGRGMGHEGTDEIEKGGEEPGRIGAEDEREADATTGEQERARAEMRSPEESLEEAPAATAQTDAVPSPPVEADASGEAKDDSDDEDMEEV